jgi:hypothetical protein
MKLRVCTNKYGMGKQHDPYSIVSCPVCTGKFRVSTRLDLGFKEYIIEKHYYRLKDD